MRPKLRRAQASGQSYLVMPTTAKYLVLRRYVGKATFNQDTKVIFFDDYARFAILQSNLHEAWARWRSGSRGVTMRYSMSNAFETFPLPMNISDNLEEVGREYHRYRQELFDLFGVGPTKIYNQIHDPGELRNEIVRMRNLMVEMDREVLSCYGWDDIKFTLEFRALEYLPTSDRIRFAIDEPTRVELFGRLSKLNKLRFSEAGALSPTGRKRVSGGGVKVHESQSPGLFDRTVDDRPKFGSME